MPTLAKVLHNKYSHPVKVKVPAGEPIYKYKYKDKKTGEIIQNEINMQEKIQSYLSQVDYKKRIELGLGLEAPILDGNLTADFTGLPDNTVDIVNLVNAIGGLSQDQIANILQSVGGVVQEGTETGQTTTQTTVSTGTEVSSSDTNTTDSNTTGGV